MVIDQAPVPELKLVTPIKPPFTHPTVETNVEPFHTWSSLPAPHVRSTPQSRIWTCTVVELLEPPASDTVAVRKCGLVPSGEVIVVTGGGVAYVKEMWLLLDAA